MKNKNLIPAAILSLSSSASIAEVFTVDVLLASGSNSPAAALKETANAIYTSLRDYTGTPTQAQTDLLAVFDYILNTADITDPLVATAVANAYNEMSPKRNGSSAIVTRKSPSTIPVKGIGKRLSALRNSTRRFNYLGSTQSPRNSGNYNLTPGLIKYNTDPALESGGLLDQRLSGFVTTNAIFSKQSDTLSEAGFKGNTQQLTLGADYRINNKTFFGSAYSYTNGNMDMTQGGDLGNTANTILLYTTHSLSNQWYADASINIGKRNFEMERSVTFNLTPTVQANSIANSKPEGSYYGFSLSTGYDKTWNNGHSISLLGSFHFTKSNIDAFTETGNNAYNLAVSKQIINSKMIDLGIEWRQAISVSFGVLVPQLSLKWTQELKDNGDLITAYFVADPDKNSLSFQTGNKDQGYMNMLLGVTVVLPKGLAGFAQYETQQFIDDYQQSMISIGARKEF